MISPLSPAWPRTLTLLTPISAGPGMSVTVGSVIFFGAAIFFLAGFGAGAGAISAAGEVAGAGIGGKVFVSCAIALAAISVPKTSQQFVFMIPTVKFLFPFLSMPAICQVSTRPA